jgi:hypothetical protein
MLLCLNLFGVYLLFIAVPYLSTLGPQMDELSIWLLCKAEGVSDLSGFVDTISSS